MNCVRLKFQAPTYRHGCQEIVSGGDKYNDFGEVANDATKFNNLEMSDGNPRPYLGRSIRFLMFKQRPSSLEVSGEVRAACDSEPESTYLVARAFL
jgi:hypothetical protein